MDSPVIHTLSHSVVLVLPAWLWWTVLGLCVANIGANVWRAYLLHKIELRNKQEPQA